MSQSQPKSSPSPRNYSYLALRKQLNYQCIKKAAKNHARLSSMLLREKSWDNYFKTDILDPFKVLKNAPATSRPPLPWNVESVFNKDDQGYLNGVEMGRFQPFFHDYYYQIKNKVVHDLSLSEGEANGSDDTNSLLSSEDVIKEFLKNNLL